MQIKNNFGSNKHFQYPKIRVRGRDLRRNPEVTDKIIYAVKNNPRITEFADRWQSEITLKSERLEYLYDNKRNISTSLFISYKEPATRLQNTFIDRLRTIFAGRKVISLFDEGETIEQAGKNLEYRLWSNDLAHVIDRFEWQSEADMKFREKYIKFFGIWFKRR